MREKKSFKIKNRAITVKIRMGKAASIPTPATALLNSRPATTPMIAESMPVPIKGVAELVSAPTMPPKMAFIPSPNDKEVNLVRVVGTVEPTASIGPCRAKTPK